MLPRQSHQPLRPSLGSPPVRPALRRSIGATVVGIALLGGCFTDSDGRQPDPTRLHYPTALTVSAGRTTLYVANSDFDLEFAGGTVLALDAAALRAAVRPIADGLGGDEPIGAAAACGDAALGVNRDQFLSPGPCTPMAVQPFIRSSRFVGAFASDLLLSYEPGGDGARLFAAVRGDPSITYFDVDDDRGGAAATFKLECNAGNDGFCSEQHRVGRDPDRSLRGIQLPPDPVGLAASADGEALVSTHQTQQAASLVVNPWGSAPFVSYFANNLAESPSEVVAIPRPAMVDAARAAAADAGRVFEYRDAFAVTYRAAAQIDVLQYVPDSGSVPPRPFVVRAQRFPLTVNASNADSRGIAILSTERDACEATCADLACLVGCAEQVPLRVFVANRAPAALLVGRIETTILTSTVSDAADPVEAITGAFDSLVIYDSIPLSFGAATVETGQVVAPDGSFVDRVFAVAFDARQVFVVDPALGAVETVIRTGRGPQDVAVDSGFSDGEPYSLLYVGHFIDSYIGVASLDQRRPRTYGELLASVGFPTPPPETR